MRLYDRVADLEFTVDGVAGVEPKSIELGEFERLTTTVALAGEGQTGRGEDVVYDADEQRRFRGYADELELSGTYTIASFSEHLAQLDLFDGQEPERGMFRRMRRWTLESAAMDLALRQHGESFAELVEQEYAPLNFVASPKLQGSLDRAERLHERRPGVGMKLDAGGWWWVGETLDRVAELPVRVVDMKAHYDDEEARGPADAETYRRVIDALPDDVLIEDPAVTRETREVLGPVKERVSWDKPIASVGDIRDLPWEPDWINIKPSRFGSWKRLLDAVQYCEEKGVRMYGGGQFELGVGREHIHALGSVFYPEGPNDVAPRVYNRDVLPEDLPVPPLEPVEGLAGLSWRYGG